MTPSALIWADLRREGPITCLRGRDRFADCIIEASAKHPSDRIRDADSGRIGHKWAWRRGRSQRVRSYDVCRSWTRSSCILEEWIRCSRIPGFRALLRRKSTRRQNAYDTICAMQSHFCKGKVVWAQLCEDGCELHGIGLLGWISSRIGLITGHFLDLR